MAIVSAGGCHENRLRVAIDEDRYPAKLVPNASSTVDTTRFRVDLLPSTLKQHHEENRDKARNHRLVEATGIHCDEDTCKH